VYRTATLAVLIVTLSSCATAPRGPAGRLADAGISATAAFGTDTTRLANDVASGSITSAFVERHQVCVPPAVGCNIALPADPNRALRRDLAAAIRLRAAALAALGQAYSALKQEADYDARGDVSGAVNEAVGSANSFAGAVFKLTNAVVPVDIGKLVAAGAGALAGSAQKRRILAANDKLREVTQRLHDALAAEAKVFDTVSDFVALNRRATVEVLMQEGLIDQGQRLQPVFDALGMPLPPGSAGALARSPALLAAAKATEAEQILAEKERIRARYRASLAALRALVVQHENLARTGSVTLQDLVRQLEELNTALAA
jgi:hypothetical protein